MKKFLVVVGIVLALLVICGGLVSADPGELVGEEPIGQLRITLHLDNDGKKTLILAYNVYEIEMGEMGKKWAIPFSGEGGEKEGRSESQLLMEALEKRFNFPPLQEPELFFKEGHYAGVIICPAVPKPAEPEKKRSGLDA